MPVLAVSRAVPQGHVLKADDLTIVRISRSTAVATVAAGEASVVVGHLAAQLLEPDTLLTTNELVTSYSPPAGASIVGVAVKEGQLPASGVAPGETVEVILTGLPGEQLSSSLSVGSIGVPQSGGTTGTTPGVASATAGTVLVPDATVLEAGPSAISSGSGAVDVSLLLPSTLGPVVASASAANQVALIIVAPAS